MVRRSIAIVLLMSSMITSGMCVSGQACSHTSFVPRIFAQNSMLELSLQDYDQLGFELDEIIQGYPWITAQADIFYFQSTHKYDLAEYFLPGCQQCITVAQTNTNDISSPWLKILRPLNSPFSSKLCLRPYRQAAGGALKLYIDLSSCFASDNCCWYKNWWASIFMPIVYVHHALHAYEVPQSDLGTAPGGFATVVGALNNPDWRYGKVTCSGSKFGIDDINVKLGLDVFKVDWAHIGCYAIGFIPTGSGTQAEILFEPLVGSNHPGLGAGINADYQFSCNILRSLMLLCDIRYAYFFKHNEVRSIDLKNGDWSRYLLVVTPDAVNNPLPGINYFTQTVDVTPGGNLDLWLALHYKQERWHFELGYDFWWRQKEKISLPSVSLNVGIFDIADCPRVTASAAAICQGIPGTGAPMGDSTFTTVTLQDFNLDSAAAPSAATSTLYGAFSHDFMICHQYPLMLGVGGSYEFSHNNNAFSQFGMWFKTDVRF